MDASNTCSSTLVNAPVPAAGQWVSVTAYMKFADTKAYSYTVQTRRYSFVDSGVLDQTFRLGSDCSTGNGLTNVIHVDNISIVPATECL